MPTLGLRCGPADYSYVILKGTQQKPELVARNEVACPAGYKRPATLNWFYQEMEDLVRKHGIRQLVIKTTEPMARKGAKTTEYRIELETVALLVAERIGVTFAVKKVKATIAKDFGMKGKAKYLTTMDTDPLPEFGDWSEKVQEAALAAWSELE